jgi:cytochrome c553
MRHALTLAVLLLGSTQATLAQDPERFTWTKEKFDFVASGDAAEGKQVAKQYRCKKCHNSDGISDDPEVPSIAGQRPTYLYKQMQDYKSGARDNREMYKVMRRLSDDEMADVAAYYTTLEPAPMVGGQKLLVMKICDSCHDKDIVKEENKIEVAPILRGQVHAYLEASMQQFKVFERSNDLFERMQSVTHKLTEDEIRHLARYYGAEPLEP